jgi:cation diffusion facilitator family transporter
MVLCLKLSNSVPFTLYYKGMTSKSVSIYAALTANLLIAVTKFIAGVISNSAAMIAEGVHSLVDTLNELLLLLGLYKSRKRPDELHPFGYGRELYFWSFIVSMIIMGLGGGISIYQGIIHILYPEQPGNPTISYIVLGCSALFESTSFIIAAKQFNKLRNGQTWWGAIVKSKDPSNFLVLFEDSAAVIGLSIVFICTYLNHQLQLFWLDGLASVLVGLLLVGISLILARESRSLLMGEGIAPETKKKITAIVEKDERVLRLMNIISSYQSPTEVLVVLIVVFKDNLNTQTINAASDHIRNIIKKEFKLIRFIIIQPETETQGVLLGNEVM